MTGWSGRQSKKKKSGIFRADIQIKKKLSSHPKTEYQYDGSNWRLDEWQMKY